MKRLIITLITALICSQLSAQPMTNADSLTLYEGTWKYENTSTHEIFIMKLLKISYISSISKKQNVNYSGTYSYTKDNLVVFDDLSLLDKYNSTYILSSAESEQIPISVANWIYKGESAFCFMDFVQNTAGEGEIKLISTVKGAEKISWTLHESEGEYITEEGQPAEVIGQFSVPKEMILTKVH